MNFGTIPLLVVSKSHYLLVPVCIISWCGANPFYPIDVVKVFPSNNRNSPFIIEPPSCPRYFLFDMFRACG
jgi:hypothetical protein